ncbi:lipopolysaccharide export system permease protein [Desulfuromusa kysingii]|uniref:Lipopolysaccharide export system permease protein n=1 Tax=Desulfuromusa kysingii TaxID=37625 RepID=A0A1H3Y6U3_9BACT|nr:LPS export ABC transporter permease LptG [Desulfuromusa kysingii]SEA07367.1 lipopolysaccharide export system permease protein [Desulfuromusa kysingii]
MKILNRFLIQHFSRILILCVTAFIGIYLLIDFFEKVDDFIDHKAALSDYLVYISNNIPVIFAQILPLAILTAMVLTLGGLSRTNEVTAMRACGISLWRIVQPLMGLVLVLSFLLLLLNEFAIPWNTKQLNTLLEVKLKGKTQVQLTRNEIWYRSNSRIINIAIAHPQDQKLEGVVIFTFDEQQKIKQRQDIDQAIFINGRWFASNLTNRKFDANSGDMLNVDQLENVALDLDRTPEDFSGRENMNNELNFRQLLAVAKKLDQEGYNSTRQRVDMHNRIAAPFTCLIMGFLGIPFALQRGRNSNLALGIGLSLGIGVVYFIIQSLVTAFGYSNALPPIFAAWTANFIFLLLGIWLLLNVKE